MENMASTQDEFCLHRICFTPSTHVETVCLLGNRNAKPDTRVKLSVDTEELQRVKNGEKI